LPTPSFRSAEAFFNRLPRLINDLRFRWMPPKSPVVGHEPIHLQVFTNALMRPYDFVPEGLAAMLAELNNAKALELDTFKFTLEQIPTIQTIEFSGWGEPLLVPDLFQMIQHAQNFNGARAVVVSNGLLSERYLDALFAATLEALIIRLHAHKPSTYWLMTGHPPAEYVDLKEALSGLIRQRARRRANLRIEVQLTVDTQTYTQIPEMIRFAEEMGVEGIRFNNFQSYIPEQDAYRTLFREQADILRFLNTLREEDYRIRVQLPPLLDSNLKGFRNCRDPFTSVGVDGSCHISPCTRQLIHFQEKGNVWDPDFWNNGQYQWLRSVHQSDASTEIPSACQGCPNNLPIPPRVLNAHL
jgi:MoaA/NifB/PqqE/SkfB family radical SAM enzyme